MIEMTGKSTFERYSNVYDVFQHQRNGAFEAYIVDFPF